MALNKRTYVANTTKITAANLNEMQDSIINLENNETALEDTIATKQDKITANGVLKGDGNGNITVAESLKNPNALTFTGASTKTYDGSKAISVTIPKINGSSASNIVTSRIIVPGSINNNNSWAIANFPAVAIINAIESGMSIYIKTPLDEILPVLTYSKNSTTSTVKFGGISETDDSNCSAVIVTVEGLGATREEIPLSVAVDSALSATSTNPIQNKVIKEELDKKLSTSGGELTGELYVDYKDGTVMRINSDYISFDEDGVGAGGACLHLQHRDNISGLELLGSDSDQPSFITGLGTPTMDNDAVNKKYVDAVAENLSYGNPIDVTADIEASGVSGENYYAKWATMKADGKNEYRVPAGCYCDNSGYHTTIIIADGGRYAFCKSNSCGR